MEAITIQHFNTSLIKELSLEARIVHMKDASLIVFDLTSLNPHQLQPSASQSAILLTKLTFMQTIKSKELIQ
jgi:hypothetical protein